MHEMSLMRGVLRLIEDSAASEGFSRVRTVRLEIGRLAGVEAEAMRFCFDAVVCGSIAEGARLEIVETGGRGWCRNCARTVEMAARYDACPHCGDYGLEITSGTEMRLMDLEVM